MSPQSDGTRAKIYRGARAKDTKSQAELDLRTHFEEQLGSEFTVIHSVGWYGKGQESVGEADFLIVHPTHGLLFIEVKGGIVSLERKDGESKWSTRNRNGHIDEIEDPCNQVERNRRALSKWFKQDPRTRDFHYAMFTSIALPDSYAPKDIRPDCPVDTIIDITHLADLKQRILSIYKYGKAHADRDNKQMDGIKAVDALIELLIPAANLKPRLLDYFEQERRKIESLTDDQKRLIRHLSSHRQAIIVGGAGSGKTMLAMQKLSNLADADFRVLYLCSTTRLANWVKRAFTDEKRVMVAHYSQLVGIVRRWAGLPSSLKSDVFYERQADLLQEGALALKASGTKNSDKIFDAIIVDEGQDFLDTWWIPLSDLLHDPEDPVFYVFMDHQQRLSAQMKELPFTAFETTLDTNVRNTRKIHNALVPYMTSNITVEVPGPEGRDIEYIPVSSVVEAHRALGRILHRLTREEGIPLDQIVVLTPLGENKSQWKEDSRIGNFTITWEVEPQSISAVRMRSISGYKGLESAVVILTEMDKVWGDKTNELVYIGLSRARNHVVVLGTLPAPLPPPISVPF